MSDIIQNGGNALIDSDHINMDTNARARLRRRAAALGSQLVFIEVFCDFSIALRRIFTAWKENPHAEQAIDKLVELLNRLPYHYEWRKSQGGMWVRKKLPFRPFAEINTSYEGEWKAQVTRVATRLLAAKR
jgi:hypothetical protein